MTSATPRGSRVIDDLIPFTVLTLVDEEPIGGGAFGAVFKAVHNEWGCQVAYKKLDVLHIAKRSKFDEQLIQSLKYEAEIHRQLRHPNIACMLGVVFEEGNYGIILEFAIYGSWIDFLNSVRHESEISCICWILKVKLSHEVSCGMSYLHNRGIIHCDLKLQNILIGELINAKISDFGLSKWKDYSRSYTNAGTMMGTPSHIPPEQWQDHPPNEKTDVYSFSILLWEMFTEKKAYEGKRGMMREWVMSGQRPLLNMLPRDVPQEIHSIIESCWDQQAANRPSFFELTASFGRFVNGRSARREINNAKEIALNKYYTSSYSVNAPKVENSNHCQKIKRVHQTLCEFIRHPGRILSSLFEKRAITDEEQTTIGSETNIYKWARGLLKVISDKPPAAYKCFLDTLDATNQHNLYLLLEDKDYKMNVDHRVTLIDNFTYLKDNITLTDSSLLDTLLEMDVLDQREVTEIRSKSTDHERTDQLLQYILRTSYEQYQHFLDALNKTHYQHVYIILTEHMKNEELEIGLNARSFLDKPRLLGLTSEHKSIYALTVLNSQLFVIQDQSTQVNVYDTNNLTLTRDITITDSSRLRAITASLQYNCLYISDDRLNVVYRYNLNDNVISNWYVGGMCYGLSVTSTHNVLVTLYDRKQIKEYTPHGSLVREISLESSIKYIVHSVQLTSDKYVISHGAGISRHRVCIVDTNGWIIQCYGGSRGAGSEQLNTPTDLGVDSYGNVMVVDHCNDRVVLLSPSLTHLGYITIPGQTLSRPCALHLDLLTRRLYIGEWNSTGRVFVLTV